MSNIVPFDFEGSAVRAIWQGDDPWFVLGDVCRVLEIANIGNAAARLDDDEKGVRIMDTLGGQQEVTVINESGLYSLILTSRKPAAKRFKKWITAEVLPALRRHGRYVMPDHDDAPAPATLADIPLEAINTGLRLVQTARGLRGPAAAIALWRELRLPGHDTAMAEPVATIGTGDGAACLGALLSAVRQDGRGTIGVAFATGWPADRDERDSLAAHGILVDPPGHRGWIAVANQSRALAAIYHGTAWGGGGWMAALRLVPGARRGQVYRFGRHGAGRATLIPAAALSPGRNNEPIAA